MAIDRIVVGVDGSAGAANALRWAVTFTDAHGGSVQAVAAWHYPYAVTIPGTMGAVPPPADMADATMSGLELLVEAALGADTAATVECVVVQGAAAGALVELSGGSDLLVVGRRGEGRFPLGSVARQVVLHAECPVAVVDDTVDVVRQPARAVVAVDGSPNAVAALEWTMRNLSAGAAIEAVLAHDSHVLDEPDASEALMRRLDEIAAEELASTVTRACAADDLDADAIEQTIVRGDPRDAIMAATGGADILVVGARSHDGFLGLVLGTFVSHAVSQAPDGVVVIAHRDHADAAAPSGDQAEAVAK